MHPLCVAGVSFSFDKPVLQDITLDFTAGNFSAILGPNGAGKSTLVKLISRWYVPSTGEIKLFGKPLRLLTTLQIAKSMAVVEQENSYGTDITVAELVSLGRLPHQTLLGGQSQVDTQCIQRAMERTGITELADRRLSTLSGGEKQRVRIATALAQDTALLILDEPTSHLDIRHQVEVLTLLRGLSREGLTVIAVLHDINLAALFCDRLIILSRGRISADGTPEQVLQPATIADAYGCNVAIQPHPVENVPQIVLMRGGE